VASIHEFLNSPIVALPRVRTDPDFHRFISSMLDAYTTAIDTLDPDCHLCARIRARKADAEMVRQHVEDAVGRYLEGHAARAYEQVDQALNYIARSLQTLFTRPVANDVVAPLYRMVRNGAAAVNKGWLFHCPFNVRHEVGQHRYGIPGFPCLYLGGSLRVCQVESRVPDADLSRVAIGEFEVIAPLKLLNFAYRPSALADIAGGSALRDQGANPPLEQFIIDYAICWPLIAASSIEVMHDRKPFVYEYIIPQMILQWIMGRTDCDGIRYFSTRWVPSPDAIIRPANFVFPAKPPSNADYLSHPLISKFSLTDVFRWRSTTGGVDFCQERRDNEMLLHAMPKAPLP